MVEEQKSDPAQDLYNKKNKITNDNPLDEYGHFISLGFSIASVIPIVNIFNIFYLYNIISIVLAVRVLKKESEYNFKKIIAIISILITIFKILITAVLFFILFGILFKSFN